MATFNSETPFLFKSLAYGRFKEQHTRCSEYYWHHILTRKMACKFSRGVSVNDDPNFLLGGNNFHLPHTFKQWKTEISETENWLRLNILLVSNSYFEQYFFEIINLLLASRPSLLLSDMKTVNGVYFLKNNIIPPAINYFCENITKGSWSKRNKLLENLIHLDCFSENDIGILDKIRKIRNKVAHRFGHDFVSDINCFFLPHPPDRLSEERLLRYLEFIEKTAQNIDSKLYPFIGNYELLLLWHLNKNNSEYKAIIDSSKKCAKIINAMHPAKFISAADAKELLKYYNHF